MNNNIKREINKIEIPVDLHERSKRGVQKAKSEIPRSRYNWKKGIVFAASLFVILGGYSLYQKDVISDQILPNISKNDSTPNSSVSTDMGIKIPAIELPDTSSKNVAMDMIGLIVFNGKIYTETATEIAPEHAKLLLGEKLGRTTGTIDEWSKQDEYSKEFASSIGEMDVYSAKGYDKDFRIIVYSERGGEIYSAFYECLNGITVVSGQDIFGNLKISGNLVNAQYRNFSDWDYSIEKYHPINDQGIIQSFVDALYQSVPQARESADAVLGDFRNDERSKEVILHLKDGSKISLFLIKDGYIRYGFADVYFKMEEAAFTRMWNEITKE